MVYLQTPQSQELLLTGGDYFLLLGLIEMHMLVSQFSVFKKNKLKEI